MSINANRLASQVRLAYEFMDALHRQAIALIKDVETQLAQAPEELQCLRPGGYKFAATPLSYGLERIQPILADYYAVCFRTFEDGVKNTPLLAPIPPIAFLKVVLRERGLEHPEARFGVFVHTERSPDKSAQQWPKKFEDLVTYLSERALVGPAWSGEDAVKRPYADSSVSLALQGVGVRLANLPDSEAIASKIVDPLLVLYREAAE